MGAVKNREDNDSFAVIAVQDTLSLKFDFAKRWIVVILDNRADFWKIT